MPLIAPNAEFTKKIEIGDITVFQCRLFDANLFDLGLLYPIWASFTLQKATVNEGPRRLLVIEFSSLPRPVVPSSERFPYNPLILEAFEEQFKAFKSKL
jgi:hypothetical protein